MTETCHYCHAPITASCAVIQIRDWNRPARTYHEACHHRDIEEHRARGARLPEDQPMFNDDEDERGKEQP
jgi:hypothetical protein